MVNNDNKQDWVAQARSRGLTGALGMLLDALEPLGPLGAQLLWVIQPVSGLFGWRKIVGDLAQSLEEPGGIEQLRQRLECEPPNDEIRSGDDPLR